MTQSLGRAWWCPTSPRRGYTLLGGLVLSTLSGAAVMLIYKKAGGDRLTFYVRPMGIGREAEMQPLDVRALKGYGWINRQIGFSAMSDGDHELLRP